MLSAETFTSRTDTLPCFCPPARLTVSTDATIWHGHWQRYQACISNAAWAEARLGQKHIDFLPGCVDAHHLEFQWIMASALSRHRDTIQIVSCIRKPKSDPKVLSDEPRKGQPPQSQSDVVETIEPNERSPRDGHRQWVKASWNIDCASSAPIQSRWQWKILVCFFERFTWEHVCK